VESVTELARRARRGDVATLMSHADRPQVFAWLREHGFVPVDYPRLRQILSAVSGAAPGPAA
jgi:hypothetical protein